MRTEVDQGRISVPGLSLNVLSQVICRTVWFLPALTCGAWFLTLAAAKAEDWPPDIHWSCEDPLLLKDTAVIREWLPTDRRFLADRENNLVYGQVSSRLIRNGSVQLATPALVHKTKLSKEMAALLSTTIEKHTQVFEAPYYMAMILPAPDFVENAIKNAIAKKVVTTFRSYLLSNIKGKKAPIDSFIPFIVAGGMLMDIGVLSAADGKYLWSQSIQYIVNVGDEQRSLMLLSCDYPAVVTISRITAINNDGSHGIVLEEQDAGDWVERGRAGDVEKQLRKTGDDSEFIYFDAPATCFPDAIREGLCLQMRASKNGGEIWDKWNRDANWVGIDEDNEPISKTSIAE